MFDSFKCIKLGFTGKLREAPTLRKYFWAFVSALIVTLLVIGYNAFMSKNYYTYLLEKFASVPGEGLAILVTCSLAIVVFFLIQSITATILDYIAGRKHKTEGHEPMFISILFALIGLLLLDVYANLQGVDEVSRITTVEVSANTADAIKADYDKQIETEQARIDRIHKKYTWKGKLYFAPTKYHPKKEYDADVKAIAQANANIERLRTAQTQAVQTALDDYSRDKQRYDRVVAKKSVGHKYLVYFAYGIAFLLSFFTGHYTDRVLAHVEGERMNYDGITQAVVAPIKSHMGFTQAQPAMKKKPENRGVKYPRLTGVLDQLDTDRLSQHDIDFLKKYEAVVQDVLNGRSIGFAAEHSGVSRSTVKNVRRVMRAVRLI